MKIFIVHKWRQSYLKIALKELLKHNSKSDIVLLTDDKVLSKEYFWYDLIYENIEDYFSLSNKFKNIYVHKSKNSFDFELICIQRWLIILEYMERNHIQSCWHIDSDVLILCDLKHYSNKYLKDCDFSYVWSCWHVFYWSKKWLEEFKEFIFPILTLYIYI